MFEGIKLQPQAIYPMFCGITCGMICNLATTKCRIYHPWDMCSEYNLMLNPDNQMGLLSFEFVVSPRLHFFESLEEKVGDLWESLFIYFFHFCWGSAFLL